KVTKLTPKDSNAWFQLAQAAQQAGNYTVAVKAYKRYLVLNPSSTSKSDTERPGGRMNFDIKTEQLSEDRYVISLAGEVDLYTAPEFKQQLLEVIAQGGKEVVVDFTNTTFIDSTTLGVLVGGVKRLRTNDGHLTLVCSDRNITKIFEITGLDRVFSIYGSREEAVAAIDKELPTSA